MLSSCDMLQDGFRHAGTCQRSLSRKRKGVVNRKASTMVMIELMKKHRANRRGFALSFAIVMVLILSFVGFGILR